MIKKNANILPLIAALFLFILPLLMTPDGEVRNQWFRFLGGFHPLIIHFPIALILLIPLLEVWKYFNDNENVTSLTTIIIKISFIASLIAPIFGWMLAWSDGFSGELITLHMWVGIMVPLGCALLLYCQRSNQMIYIVTLLITVGLVSWTGYLGGELAHGRGHITKNMPDGLRATLNIEKPTMVALDDPNSFYGSQISPIFAARCVSCHGADKIKGQLRLDAFEHVMNGGKNGPVIVAKNANESEIIRRITLPATHDEFMPAEGNPAMSEAEINLISQWIDDGAELNTMVAGNNSSIDLDLPVAVVVPDYDPAGAFEARSMHAETVTKLQETYPFIVNYISRNSAEIDLNATMMRAKFTDQDLASFEPVLDQINRADFSATSITDASIALILKMENLEILKLNQTNITDEAILELLNLPKLKSLNLRGLEVSEKTKTQLSTSTSIEQLYTGLD